LEKHQIAKVYQITDPIKLSQVGLVLLVLFCAFRPIALTDISLEGAGLNVMELFAITISYSFCLFVLTNIRRIEIDLISLIIILFCFYSVISLFWGSKIRTITQVILPFIIYFAVRITVRNPMHIKILVVITIISFCYPLIGSFIKICQGISVGKVEATTGIERHIGLFKSIKPLAYAMFFFSVFVYIQIFLISLKKSKYIMFLVPLLIVSLFCLYKTYSRTAFIGLFLFWSIGFWGYNRRYLVVLLLLSSILVGLQFPTIEQIFLKQQKFEINTASSGRPFLWEHNINLFLASSFDDKLLGHGLGVGSSSVIGSNSEIWSSHNDYLHLIMHLGIVGLVLYILIHLAIIKDIYSAGIDKSIKFFYYGLVSSVAVMNFASGITVYNVGISQIYWLVIGLLYVFKRESERRLEHVDD
jgi:O-antigen ligase